MGSSIDLENCPPGPGGHIHEARSVTVTDRAITSVSASGSASVTAGAAYTLNLSANEDATSWTINWGDGSIQTVSGDPATVTHTYTQAGFTFNILASATDASGTVHNSQLLVPTYGSGDSVMRFAPMTGAHLQTFANHGSTTNPIQAVVGPDGRLYVTQEGQDTVRRYDTATGALIGTFVAAGSGGLSSPGGLAFGPDGNLYVASWDTNRVLRYNGSTGAFIDAFVPSVSRPYSLAFGADGRLYVGLYSGDAVARYDGTTGALVDTFVSAGSGGLDAPEQLTFGPDGHLYVASFNSHEVLRYDGSTGNFMGAFVAAGAGGLNKPSGVSFGPDGALYVASLGTDSILRYDGSTGAYLGAYVAAGAGGLVDPTMMTFVPQQQVQVLPAVNQAPVITSNGGGASAAIVVAENTSAVTTVTSSDPDGPAPTYSIVGGDDQARFGIDASSGALRFLVPPNFEAPTDAGANNVYDVIVRASDGSLNADQTIAVTVGNAVEALLTTGEQIVNTGTGGVQETSAAGRGSPRAVAMAPDGSHVVVWSSDAGANGWGVYGQRFDKTGAAVGGEFAVNQTIVDAQRWATVAMDADGRFVVSWTSANQDGTGQSVYARRYNADGSASRRRRVPRQHHPTGNQYDSSVAMDANGNFVVVWQGNGPGDSRRHLRPPLPRRRHADRRRRVPHQHRPGAARTGTPACR